MGAWHHFSTTLALPNPRDRDLLSHSKPCQRNGVLWDFSPTNSQSPESSPAVCVHFLTLTQCWRYTPYLSWDAGAWARISVKLSVSWSPRPHWPPPTPEFNPRWPPKLNYSWPAGTHQLSPESHRPKKKTPGRTSSAWQHLSPPVVRFTEDSELPTGVNVSVKNCLSASRPKAAGMHSNSLATVMRISGIEIERVLKIWLNQYEAF